jgi:hypothetical protein
MYDAPPVDHAWRLNFTAMASDTTLAFAHNTDFTDIEYEEPDPEPEQGEGNRLTLNFTSMTPHLGQKLEVRVVDTYNRKEADRLTLASIDSANFSVMLDGLASGRSYYVDFYADHNSNGLYDVPGTDHAWRLELNDVSGDTSLNFTHNTTFTDIRWPYALTLDVSSLTPHLGQMFEVRLLNKTTMEEVYRDSLSSVAEADFAIVLPGIEAGEIYYVDFYADHNGNSLYDAPPADHAWRMELENTLAGDSTLYFTHNTTFTDIAWPYLLTLQFSGMTPHLGQELNVRAIDRRTEQETGRSRLAQITHAAFELSVVGAAAAGKYRLEFYADHNSNGLYDAPPVDHAWAMDVETISGNVETEFAHNTNFSMLDWDYRVFLAMQSMTPHLNQPVEIRVVDQSTSREIVRRRIASLYAANVTATLPGFKAGTDYNIDFYADHNGNGMYDAPTADHAWRIAYNAGSGGDSTVVFTHNTTFTDIEWRYNFTLAFTGMTPHLNQYLEVRLVETESGEVVAVDSVSSVPDATFSISLGELVAGTEYNVDFYADHNGNGMYDAPPVDHAWRLNFTAMASDTTLAFAHNTDFTDIEGVNSLDRDEMLISEYKLFSNYPNPFNPQTNVKFHIREKSFVQLNIYNVMGQVVKTLVSNSLDNGAYVYTWDGTNNRGQKVVSGVYFYRLDAGSFSEVKRMVLIK